MEDLVLRLRNHLKSIKKPDSILLSGGLDSSIVALSAKKAVAFTVVLEGGASDLFYSKLVSSFLSLNHKIRVVKMDEALEAIPLVIKYLKTFDPAIPNDLCVFFGLIEAKKESDSIMTGDGADEFFAGYSYMNDIEDLKGYIENLRAKVIFSSNILGDALGIGIFQPFLLPEMIDFALEIPPSLKIKDGINKWILRKAFEDSLPKKIIWQEKRSLEHGSGMSRLRKIIDQMVSDDEFNDTRFPKFMSKEHLYYYKIYREVVGEIPKPKGDEKPCPACSAGIEPERFHCRVCGYCM